MDYSRRTNNRHPSGCQYCNPGETRVISPHPEVKGSRSFEDPDVTARLRSIRNHYTNYKKPEHPGRNKPRPFRPRSLSPPKRYEPPCGCGASGRNGPARSKTWYSPYDPRNKSYDPLKTLFEHKRPSYSHLYAIRRDSSFSDDPCQRLSKGDLEHVPATCDRFKSVSCAKLKHVRPIQLQHPHCDSEPLDFDYCYHRCIKNDFDPCCNIQYGLENVAANNYSPCSPPPDCCPHMCPWDADITVNGTVRAHCDSTADVIASKLSGHFRSRGKRFCKDTQIMDPNCCGEKAKLCLGRLEDGCKMNFSRNHKIDLDYEFKGHRSGRPKYKQTNRKITHTSSEEDQNGQKSSERWESDHEETNSNRWKLSSRSSSEESFSSSSHFSTSIRDNRKPQSQKGYKFWTGKSPKFDYNKSPRDIREHVSSSILFKPRTEVNRRKHWEEGYDLGSGRRRQWERHNGDENIQRRHPLEERPSTDRVRRKYKWDEGKWASNTSRRFQLEGSSSVANRYLKPYNLEEAGRDKHDRMMQHWERKGNTCCYKEDMSHMKYQSARHGSRSNTIRLSASPVYNFAKAYTP